VREINGGLLALLSGRGARLRSALLVAAAALLSAISLAASVPLFPDTPKRDGAASHGFAFVGAARCRSCHAAIFEEWSGSWMGRAYTNAFFQSEFRRWQTLAPTLGEHPLSCLRCHAPAGLIAARSDRRQELAAEGVTCEMCHRVNRVSARADGVHSVLDPAPIIYGRTAIEAEAHPVRQSPALTDPALCGTCHLDRRGDVYLERTYAEWQASPHAAEGVGCIDCHMPRVAGPATEGSDRAVHASHAFPGGHAGSPLLDGVATLTVDEATATGLRLSVANVGAGHSFPTGGAHDTRLVLEVRLLDGGDGVLHRDRRIYEVAMLDSEGRIAGPEQTVAEVVDTTLGPRETRIERFDWADTGGLARIEARLVYERSVSPPADIPDRSLRAIAPVEIASCRISVENGTIAGTARCTTD